MSSSDQPELKAGHPPAVKVGGMRVIQNKPSHGDKPVAEQKKDDEVVEGEEEAVQEVSTSPKLIKISGVIAKGDADFPPDAIKAFHEKPLPAHDFRAASSKPNIIQQPRK